MALVVKDRVKETTSTTGTGTLTLGGAVTGFQTFTSVLSNSDTTYYAIFESSTGEFEVGLGTFTSSGTTLARTTVLESSNSGNAINLTAGAADVFITQPAEKSVYLDSSGHIAAADGRNVTNVAASTATTAGTVTTAAQPNITSLGTLTTLTVDDITINGSTISDGGTLTIDAAGEINLDADTGGAVRLMDASVNYGTFYSSSSDFVILSQAQDKDIIFQGNDGGSSIEAMRIDMSAGGYLGIGTASPSQLIELRNTSGSFGAEATIRGSTSAGAPKAEIAFKRESSGDDTSIVFRPSDNGTLNATAMTLNHNGNLGIGVSAPDQPLQVKGIIEAQATNSTNGWMLYTYTDNTFRVNYNGSGSDEITIDTSGNMTVTGSLTVDDITIDGSTISDAADLTIDVGGDIILDADSNDIIFKDGGTQFSKIRNDGNTNAELYGTLNIHLRPNNGTNATTNYVWNQGHVTPWADSYFDLGSASYGWKDGYFTGNITVGSNISHDGDSDTYLQFDAANSFRIVVGNTQTFKTTTSDITISANIKLGSSGENVFIYHNNAKWLGTPGSAYQLVIGDSGSNPWTGNTGVRLMFGSSDVNAQGQYYIGTNLEDYGGNYNKLDIDYGTGIRLKANKTYGGTRFYDAHNDALLLSVGAGNTDVGVVNNLTVGGNVTVAADIIHEGDTDTKISFGTDSVQTYAGGTSTWQVYGTYVALQGYMYNYYTYYDESSQLTGTTPTINTADSGNFYLTMSGNTTFTFTNAQTGGSWACGFTLYLTGNGSTVTWPNSVNWAGGTAPDAPANGEVDVLVFHTRDGANWYGALAIDAAS